MVARWVSERSIHINFCLDPGTNSVNMEETRLQAAESTDHNCPTADADQLLGILGLYNESYSTKRSLEERILWRATFCC
jgi:hypothetical protein